LTARWLLNRGAGRVTRYATIPAEGRWAVFKRDESRFAIGVAETVHAIGHKGPPTLSFLIADPDGHLFDGSPLALLDPERVRELRNALDDWLGRAA
jgi:hypothetical protein